MARVTTDVATYRSWLAQTVFTVDREEFVAEGDSGHSLFWARRAGTAPGG